MAKLATLVALLTFFIILGNLGAYTTYLYAPAVLSNENRGTLTMISLNVTPGTGAVSVVGPSSVADSTLSSAQTGVAYATSYLNVNQSNYNFTYTINDPNISVSGPSAGLAFTVLAISGIEQRPLLHDFTLTGTINPDGTVGLIGGAYDKGQAAAQNGMKFFIVPYSNETIEEMIYYITQQTYSIPVVEVNNTAQALRFVFNASVTTPLVFNVSQNYYVGNLSQVNVSCVDCNVSDYRILTNFTLNKTYSEINSIQGNYSTLKSSMISQLNQYRQIAKSGYLYSAADLSFLEYITAFTFANSGNLNISSASVVINNVSNYCNSISTPPLTNLNYEYVTAGQIRQSWGNLTANVVVSSLNSSDTGDEVIENLYTAGSASGWCSAANEMYSIASSVGGNYVTESPAVKSKASSLINSDGSFGSSMYLTSATQLFAQGNYAAALYSATYANVFENPDLFNNEAPAELINATIRNVGNATNGIWPAEFALQSEFYLREATLNPSLGNSTISSAYTTSILAWQLSDDNALLNNTFVELNSTSVSSGQYNIIEGQISQLYDLMVVIIVLMFLIFVIILAVLLRSPKAQAQSQKASTRRTRQVAK